MTDSERAELNRRRVLHAVEVLITPRLWREQIEYMRHGPAPEPEPEPEPEPVVEPEPDFPTSPWRPRPPAAGQAVARCNICLWHGTELLGARHVEQQLCPSCGSSGRDRFLFHCFVSRQPAHLGLTVLETSPRLGEPYRRAMHRWFRYMCSDFDASCHKGELQLDLQSIGMRDRAVDIVLTPHVLEHVPDTEAALAELLRILRPGGVVYLQVPILQGLTAPPGEPEFHDDNTPVFWRFGFDLAAHLRSSGFDTTLLCTEPFAEAVASGLDRWPEPASPEFDVTSMLAAASAGDLTPVIGKADAEQLGFWHGYMFLTFECRRPG